MQTINQSTFDYLKSGNLVDVRIRCSGLAGDLTILGEDIIQGTFSIDRNSTSGVNVEIGCAETTELTFELNNADHRFDSYKFEGAVLTVDILANDEYIRAGRFIVDKRPNTYRRVKIVALDYMAKFNKVYVPTVANGATLFEILQDCCTQCGVTMHDLSIVNGSVPCLVPTDEVTCHEVVSMVAELSGANAWIDYNGELNLSWYGENQSSEIVIDSGSRFSYDVAENDIVISGVVYRTEDTDTLIGSDTYALIIENNDLVDSTQVSTLLTNIYNRVNGTIYRPFKFDIQGMPHYWPLDVITFADANGTLFTSIITNHNYILNGVSSIQGKGESATIASYAANSPFTARQKKVLNKVIDLRAGQQITALDQAMIQLNELAANAQGFYQTVVTDPVTQARIDYMHNQPLLANSTIVYKRTVDGFFWTDNYQGESTVWTSGYTASGNIVAKTLSVVGINADWVNAGSVTSRNYVAGTGDYSTAGTRLDLDNGIIKSTKFAFDSTGQVFIRKALEIENGLVINCGKNPSYTVSTTLDNMNCQDFGTKSGLGLWVNGMSFFDQTAHFDAYINVSNGIHVGGTSENETPFLMLHSSSGGGGGYVQADGGVYADDNIESNNDMWADAFNLNSDARLKENVAPIQSGVDLVLGLNPVQYTMIDGDSGRTHYGFIAQELKQTMTNVGIEDCAAYVDRSFETPDDPARQKDTLGLRYMELIAPMVQTIQHLEKRIADLEAKLGG